MSLRLLRCLRGSRHMPEVTEVCLWCLRITKVCPRYARGGLKVHWRYLRCALGEYVVSEVFLRWVRYALEVAQLCYKWLQGD
jgi:hypothetical protein